MWFLLFVQKLNVMTVMTPNGELGSSTVGNRACSARLLAIAKAQQKTIAQAAAVIVFFGGQGTPSCNISSFNDQS